MGFVCSICLSSEFLGSWCSCFERREWRADGASLVFCSPPEGAICLTCGTHLRLGEYGAKPIVVARKKKKRKGGVNGKGREVT